jgi:uncharacterized membrane protein YjjP (DUF1212 family)
MATAANIPLLAVSDRHEGGEFGSCSRGAALSFTDILAVLHGHRPAVDYHTGTFDEPSSKSRRAAKEQLPRPLCDSRRRFLVQLASCLMACPLEIPLPVSQYIVLSCGKAMGQPSMTVSLGMRVALLSPSGGGGGGGGGGDLMLATPVAAKPVMQNLSDMLYLVNGFLGVAGGPSEAQLAQLSTCIQAVLQRPPPVAAWWVGPVGTCLIGAGYCPIFRGGWPELLLAGLLSLALSALGFWKRLSARYENIYYITIGVVATLVPLWCNARVQSINIMATALSVQMWWLPGLEIVAAVKHLGFGRSIEGVSMLFHALFTCFMLAFGMGFGFTLAQAAGLDTTAISTPSAAPVPAWADIFFLLLATLGAVLLKQASPAVFFAPMAVASVAGYYATSWATPALGTYSPLAGGFVLELVTLAYNLVTAQPFFPIIAVGLLPIVPGSTALNGVFASVEQGQANGGQDLGSSIDFLGSMFMISFCM